jgi:RNA-directed DNA polymerase
MSTGDDVTQRSGTKLDFSDDLFERVLLWNNLQAACKRVRANKGATDIDGMTIDELPVWTR